MTAAVPRSVAVQALDLAPLAHPHQPSEWRYRPKGFPAALPAATGFGEPDAYGATVWIEQRTWTAEQLPGLIAFLVAVQDAQPGGAR